MLSNIITMIKSRLIRWAGHVVFMDRLECMQYRDRKTFKRFRTYGYRWKDNISIDFKETENVFNWWNIFEHGKEILDSIKVGNVLTKCDAIKFSRLRQFSAIKLQIYNRSLKIGIFYWRRDRRWRVDDKHTQTYTILPCRRLETPKFIQGETRQSFWNMLDLNLSINSHSVPPSRLRILI